MNEEIRNDPSHDDPISDLFDSQDVPKKLEYPYISANQEKQIKESFYSESTFLNGHSVHSASYQKLLTSLPLFSWNPYLISLSSSTGLNSHLFYPSPLIDVPSKEKKPSNLEGSTKVTFSNKNESERESVSKSFLNELWIGENLLTSCWQPLKPLIKIERNDRMVPMNYILNELRRNGKRKRNTEDWIKKEIYYLRRAYPQEFYIPNQILNQILQDDESFRRSEINPVSSCSVLAIIKCHFNLPLNRQTNLDIPNILNDQNENETFLFYPKGHNQTELWMTRILYSPNSESENRPASFGPDEMEPDLRTSTPFISMDTLMTKRLLTTKTSIIQIYVNTTFQLLGIRLENSGQIYYLPEKEDLWMKSHVWKSSLAHEWPYFDSPTVHLSTSFWMPNTGAILCKNGLLHSWFHHQKESRTWILNLAELIDLDDFVNCSFTYSSDPNKIFLLTSEKLFVVEIMNDEKITASIALTSTWNKQLPFGLPYHSIQNQWTGENFFFQSHQLVHVQANIYHQYQYVIVDQHRLSLFDIRMPQRPLVSWFHHQELYPPTHTPIMRISLELNRYCIAAWHPYSRKITLYDYVIISDERKNQTFTYHALNTFFNVDTVVDLKGYRYNNYLMEAFSQSAPLTAASKNAILIGVELLLQEQHVNRNQKRLLLHVLQYYSDHELFSMSLVAGDSDKFSSNWKKEGNLKRQREYYEHDRFSLIKKPPLITSKILLSKQYRRHTRHNLQKFYQMLILGFVPSDKFEIELSDDIVDFIQERNATFVKDLYNENSLCIGSLWELKYFFIMHVRKQRPDITYWVVDYYVQSMLPELVKSWKAQICNLLPLVEAEDATPSVTFNTIYLKSLSDCLTCRRMALLNPGSSVNEEASNLLKATRRAILNLFYDDTSSISNKNESNDVVFPFLENCDHLPSTLNSLAYLHDTIKLSCRIVPEFGHCLKHFDHIRVRNDVDDEIQNQNEQDHEVSLKPKVYHLSPLSKHLLQRWKTVGPLSVPKVSSAPASRMRDNATPSNLEVPVKHSEYSSDHIHAVSRRNLESTDARLSTTQRGLGIKKLGSNLARESSSSSTERDLSQDISSSLLSISQPLNLDSVYSSSQKVSLSQQPSGSISGYSLHPPSSSVRSDDKHHGRRGVVHLSSKPSSSSNPLSSSQPSQGSSKARKKGF